MARLESPSRRPAKHTLWRLHAAWMLGLLVVSMQVSGSSNPVTQPLAWPVAGETLSYRSCGCADGCWVAELRHAGTGAVKARLRCDCEQLHFSRSGHEGERRVAESCRSINESPQKFDAIRLQMERLVQPQRAE